MREVHHVSTPMTVSSITTSSQIEEVESFQRHKGHLASQGTYNFSPCVWHKCVGTSALCTAPGRTHLVEREGEREVYIITSNNNNSLIIPQG